MKTKQQIQERIDTLNKEIEIHRKDLHSIHNTTNYNELLYTIDRLRAKKDVLEWVIDLVD